MRYYICLQMVRNNANQVASGDESVIGGGERNKVTGNHCTISGGMFNIAGGGYGSIAGGYLCETTGQCSTVTGGAYNTASESYSTVIGVRSKSRWEGHITFGATSDSVMGNKGGQQAGITIYQKQTTDATATSIGTNIYASASSTSRRVTLPNNSAFGFRITVVAAVTSGGDSSMWTLEGLIKRGSNAASTTIVGSVTKTRIANDSGASAWDVDVTANTSYGYLDVTVTGQASTTIRWVAKIETTELSFS